MSILGLDALASAAYGPEALLTVLMPLGAAGVRHMWQLTPPIVVVLLLVYLSYRQTIPAYPGGGGAYTVARTNLGRGASLLAAAGLMLDYLLNVAVAIAAGVGALVSALPSLLPHTLTLCLAVLALLTLINLRGVRATGAAFMLPTYLFLACMLGLIAYGAFRGGLHGTPAPRAQAADAVSTWLLLRAFASGCTALTGVEAVSNGVPIFREPGAVHARRTLGLIVLSLTVMLLGEALLCTLYGVTATPPGSDGYRSVLSQLLERVAGRGPFYYVSMGSVIAVLTLSANTSFAGFPRLCRILAEHGCLPELFAHRGRRLVFSHGILLLSALSALLLIGFGGITDALIPLFAVGAFLAFSISQLGMVAHWRREQGRHARSAMILNGAGAAATSITLLIVLASKFREGAWLTLPLIGCTALLLHGVRRHQDFVARVTAISEPLEFGPPRRPIVVVPLRRWDAMAFKALRFAVDFAPEVLAVQVLTGEHEVDDLSARWQALVEAPALRAGRSAPRLVTLRSQYRQLFVPLLQFVTQLAREQSDRQVAVVVPELVEPRWYHKLLHSHTASLLRALLIFRGGPQIVVISTPWYVADWLPERARLLRRRARERQVDARKQTADAPRRPA